MTRLADIYVSYLWLAAFFIQRILLNIKNKIVFMKYTFYLSIILPLYPRYILSMWQYVCVHTRNIQHFVFYCTLHVTQYLFTLRDFFQQFGHSKNIWFILKIKHCRTFVCGNGISYSSLIIIIKKVYNIIIYGKTFQNYCTSTLLFR